MASLGFAIPPLIPDLNHKDIVDRKKYTGTAVVFLYVYLKHFGFGRGEEGIRR